MTGLIRNLRHAARVLFTSRGFTSAAVVTLALGIGANTAIFSLIKAVMLQPLPYRNAAELVMVWHGSRPDEATWLSNRELLSYREEGRSFAQLAAYVETDANVTGGQDPERVRAAAVTANIFDTLGVTPLVGRSFVAGEDGPGAAATVVLSHSLWQRRFGGAPDIVGKTLPISGRPRTVIGVMPASVRLPVDYRATRPTELWFPLIIDPADLGQWGSRSSFVVGRLAPGVEPTAATSELQVIARRWISAGFVKDGGDGTLFRSAIPVQEFVTGNVRRPLLVLLGAVGVVLLVACANVVNLLLARADARRREIAVRTALGARRGDLVRQLLTESVLLSSLGGLAGLGLARAAMQILTTLRPAGLPRVEEASIDSVALAFTAGLSIATGLIFGLLPAIHLSRLSITGTLNESGRGGAQGKVRHGVRRTLVVAQLAFSVVLVVGAALLLRSLIALNRIDLGFNPDRVLTAQVQLTPTDYPTDEGVVAFYRQVIERLEVSPGVQAAGAVRMLPLTRIIGDWSITIEGRPLASPNENPNADYQSATPGYFRVMGTALLRGRLLTNADREDAPLVVVINDTMAERYWPGQDAIGKRFQMGGTGTTRPPMTIVGIVRTSRHNAVVEEPRAEVYLPHAQLPRSMFGSGRSLAIVIKTEGDPLTAVTPLREIVRSMDPNLPLADIRPMDEVTSRALAGPRFAAWLLGLFAALALTLAAIGTYATVSLLVTERAQEIGIRIALGAERATILLAVLREGFLLAGVGVAIGIIGALLGARALETLLYGVGTLDLATFMAVPLALLIVATLAALTPAMRAASMDPAAALRQG
jgi:putative ABC transport system permease protein